MALDADYSVVLGTLGLLAATVIFAYLCLAAFVRYRGFIRSLDRGRIVQDIKCRGGVFLSGERVYNPIEWFFTRGSVRHYHVTYRIGNGAIVDGNCVTSFWTGVHWTGDTIRSHESSVA